MRLVLPPSRRLPWTVWSHCCIMITKSDLPNTLAPFRQPVGNSKHGKIPRLGGNLLIDGRDTAIVDGQGHGEVLGQENDGDDVIMRLKQG